MAFLIVAVQALHAGEPSAVDEFLTWIRTKMHERQNRQTMRKVAIMDAVLSGIRPSKVGWEWEHPVHRDRVKRFIAGLSREPQGDTIAFGDSLLDYPRKTLRSVPEPLNFSITGSWPHHMLQMVGEITPVLERSGKKKSINYVIVGSLGGNPLLMRQPVTATIGHSLVTLDAVRRHFPSARIIVFGIPPTVSTYVNTNAIAFETALYRWVLADRDAVLLPLQRKFSGWLGLYPKALMSVDGIHFSPQGALEFDKLIDKGKKAQSHIIVD